MEQKKELHKQDFSITIEQNFFDGIFNFIGINIVIYLFFLKFNIGIRLSAIFIYSILNTIFHVKRLTINENGIHIKYPVINQDKIVLFDNIIEINFFNKERSRKAEYMDLEIKYYNSKNKKKIDDIPLKDFNQAKSICLFLKTKVGKENFKSNDIDINKIICQN